MYASGLILSLTALIHSIFTITLLLISTCFIDEGIEAIERLAQDAKQVSGGGKPRAHVCLIYLG